MAPRLGLMRFLHANRATWLENAMRRLTRSWSHCLVIRPAAALRRNPGDVAVRVLDVAGFAMDAILGVDLVTRPGRLLDPFIDASRAIAVGRPGIDVVLGGLLQVHVGDLQMNRLVLFV